MLSYLSLAYRYMGRGADFLLLCRARVTVTAEAAPHVVKAAKCPSPLRGVPEVGAGLQRAKCRVELPQSQSSEGTVLECNNLPAQAGQVQCM